MMRPNVLRILVAAIALLTTIFSVGCNGSAIKPVTTGQPPTSEAKAPVTAVYLRPAQGGALTTTDLDRHPQVVVVQDQAGLASAATTRIAIWIDKDATSLVDQQWINERSGEGYPIAVIGSASAVHDFGELLDFIMSIPGPVTDEARAQPGFAVWMVTEIQSNRFSATNQGYPGTPTVEAILHVTDELLKAAPPVSSTE